MKHIVFAQRRCFLLTIYLFILAMLPLNTIAQIKSYQLDGVTIQATPINNFSDGSHVQHLDSLQKNQNNQGSLSDLLLQNSTIYLKEYGNGMMSTVSIRGTGAERTAVLWHGLNLNSLTLGGSDFSTYPIFLFDQIDIQYGGAGALYGSDAIGGTIHLQTKPSWKQGVRLQLQQDIGSYGNFFSGLKVGVGNGKWESVTKLFRFSLQNDFTYPITDRLGNEYEVRQENASIQNYGLMQELNYRFTEKDYISVQGWYGYNFHQIQPLMVSDPNAPQPADDLLNKNLRLVADYNHYTKSGLLNSSLAYVWDYQLFNKTDVIQTQRLIGTINYETDISKSTLLRAGGNSKYIVPLVHAYAEGTEEWRGDVYLSIRQILSKGLNLTANLRKSFVPFTQTPVAPSLAMKYVHPVSTGLISLRFLADRSFRVPTFNDRYWRDQGRKDLNSEKGYNLETGANLNLKKGNHSWSIDLSTYWMLIDDWIAWRPDVFLSDRDQDGIPEPVSDWRPANLKKVQGSGVELMLQYDLSVNGYKISLNTQYAYNATILKESGKTDDPSIGYQLPYTPTHRYTIGANIEKAGYFINLTNYYIGKRTGQDVIGDVYPGYALVNLNFGKNIHFTSHHTLSASLTINNLGNTNYQNMRYRAMPGRNYLISIKYFLTN